MRSSQPSALPLWISTIFWKTPNAGGISSLGVEHHELTRLMWNYIRHSYDDSHIKEVNDYCITARSPRYIVSLLLMGISSQKSVATFPKTHVNRYN
jgi:hypothetical protein